MAENNDFYAFTASTIISRETEIAWWRRSICSDKEKYC